MKIREDMINVSQGQQDATAARGLSVAAIITAIPLPITVFTIALVCIFIAAAAGFNAHSVPVFFDTALAWLKWGFITVVILVCTKTGLKLGMSIYGHYHEVKSKSLERRIVSANLQRHQALAEKAELQNDELRARIQLTQSMPALVQYAIQAGQNIEVDNKGTVRVQSWMSNLHQLPEAGQVPALPEPGGQELIVTPFRELLQGGVIQSALKDGEFLLGYEAETGALRYGTWLDLYSCAIGGVSGSGKSTTVRFLLFQSILAAGRLIMIDPHIGDEEESLAAQFRMFPGIHQFPPCDASVNAVLKRIQWLLREFDRRKKTGTKGPILTLVIDEFNAVMREKEIKEELSVLLLKIEQEARKFGIFAMLIGQRWSAQDIGGADIRSSLASKLAHRFSDQDQAARFMGTKYGSQLLELETGYWLFYDTHGKTTRMVTPETTAEDGQDIARMLGVKSPGQGRYVPETSYENTLKPAETTALLPAAAGGKIISIDAHFSQETSEKTPGQEQENSNLIALARQVMALQAGGVQKPDIMRQVWNVSPGGTEAYRRAQEEYQAVMQFIANKIGA